MRAIQIFGLGLLVLASQAKGAPTSVERIAEQKLVAEMRCVMEPRPDPLIQWMLKNKLVTSIGVGADGIARLVPTRPLSLFGFRVLYIEAWGAQELRSGKLNVRPPFELAPGMKMQFIAVVLAGLQQELEPIIEKRLPKARVYGDSKDHFLQITEVACTDLDQSD